MNDAELLVIPDKISRDASKITPPVMLSPSVLTSPPPESASVSHMDLAFDAESKTNIVPIDFACPHVLKSLNPLESSSTPSPPLPHTQIHPEPCIGAALPPDALQLRLQTQTQSSLFHSSSSNEYDPHSHALPPPHAYSARMRATSADVLAHPYFHPQSMVQPYPFSSAYPYVVFPLSSGFSPSPLATPALSAPLAVPMPADTRADTHTDDASANADVADAPDTPSEAEHPASSAASSAGTGAASSAASGAGSGAGSDTSNAHPAYATHATQPTQHTYTHTSVPLAYPHAPLSVVAPLRLVAHGDALSYVTAPVPVPAHAYSAHGAHAAHSPQASYARLAQAMGLPPTEFSPHHTHAQPPLEAQRIPAAPVGGVDAALSQTLQSLSTHLCGVLACVQELLGRVDPAGDTRAHAQPQRTPTAAEHAREAAAVAASAHAHAQQLAHAQPRTTHTHAQQATHTAHRTGGAAVATATAPPQSAAGKATGAAAQSGSIQAQGGSGRLPSHAALLEVEYGDVEDEVPLPLDSPSPGDSSAEEDTYNRLVCGAHGGGRRRRRRQEQQQQRDGAHAHAHVHAQGQTQASSGHRAPRTSSEVCVCGREEHSDDDLCLDTVTSYAPRSPAPAPSPARAQSASTSVASARALADQRCRSAALTSSSAPVPRVSVALSQGATATASAPGTPLASLNDAGEADAAGAAADADDAVSTPTSPHTHTPPSPLRLLASPDRRVALAVKVTDSTRAPPAQNTHARAEHTCEADRVSDKDYGIRQSSFAGPDCECAGCELERGHGDARVDARTPARTHAHTQATPEATGPVLRVDGAASVTQPPAALSYVKHTLPQPLPMPPAGTAATAARPAVLSAHLAPLLTAAAVSPLPLPRAPFPSPPALVLAHTRAAVRKDGAGLGRDAELSSPTSAHTQAPAAEDAMHACTCTHTPEPAAPASVDSNSAAAHSAATAHGHGVRQKRTSSSASASAESLFRRQEPVLANLFLSKHLAAPPQPASPPLRWRTVRVGVDVGGTLAKLCYYSPYEPLPSQVVLKQRLDAFLAQRPSLGVTGRRSEELQVDSPVLGGTLHFVKFDSARIQAFFALVHEQELRGVHVFATGGGAVKYKEAFIHAIRGHGGDADGEGEREDACEGSDCAVCVREGEALEQLVLEETIGSQYTVTDEMASLVRGMDFLIRFSPGECFSFKRYLFHEELEMYTRAPPSFPFLLVNIGSGVSILRVDDEHNYVRVGGSSLGGGTFYGLCRLLTGCQSFAEALALAHHGKGSKVDLLVSDIYGRDYSALGLSGDTIAASFGKLARTKSDVSREDLAKAALVMITNNICSLAHLYARQVLRVPSVVFVGNFLRNNLLAMRMLSYALMYWSSNTIEAIFLKHEGYFGSLGALLAGEEEKEKE